MRGYLKRRRQRRAVESHISKFDGFRFRAEPVVIPGDVKLSIQAAIADGDYETAECDLIERHLPNDKPVIELGGCLGLVSCFTATRLLEETQHIVVEANPALTDACRQNATLGGLRGNTEVIQKAIAYDGREVAFSVGENIHIGKLAQGGEAGSVLVAPVSLAELVERIGSPDNYSLICDIEGAELDILVRDSAALERCGMMIMEFHPMAYGEHGKTIDDLLVMIRRTGLSFLEQQQNVIAFAR